MKFTTHQTALKAALAKVGPSVAGRTSLPVLSNVLIVADGEVWFTTNNLETAICVPLVAAIAEPGAGTVPYKLLSDLVGNLPAAEVGLAWDDKACALKVTCNGSTSTIKGIEADEYPSLPPAAGAVLTTIPAEWLREVAASVAIAAAASHTNPTLQGVLTRLDGAGATFAAIDGYRLAVRFYAQETAGRAVTDIVLPSRVFADLGRVMTGDVTLALTPNGGQAIFTGEGATFWSRVLDGKFPDYHRFVPLNYETGIFIGRDELLRAVKRVALFSQSGGNIIKLIALADSDEAHGWLHLEGAGVEIGDAKETVVPHEWEGSDNKIALNVHYLEVALAAITTAQVKLELNDAKSPAIVRPVGAGAPEYFHLVMPMSLPA